MEIQGFWDVTPYRLALCCRCWWGVTKRYKQVLFTSLIDAPSQETRFCCQRRFIFNCCFHPQGRRVLTVCECSDFYRGMVEQPLTIEDCGTSIFRRSRTVYSARQWHIPKKQTPFLLVPFYQTARCLPNPSFFDQHKIGGPHGCQHPA